MAVRLAAPAARVTGSATFLAARDALLEALVVARFAADLVPAGFRTPVDGVRGALFDVVADFFAGGMSLRYPAVGWRNRWTRRLGSRHCVGLPVSDLSGAIDWFGRVLDEVSLLADLTRSVGPGRESGSRSVNGGWSSCDRLMPARCAW